MDTHEVAAVALFARVLLFVPIAVAIADARWFAALICGVLLLASLIIPGPVLPFLLFPISCLIVGKSIAWHRRERTQAELLHEVRMLRKSNGLTAQAPDKSADELWACPDCRTVMQEKSRHCPGCGGKMTWQ